jgi:hypothetical protein
MHFSKWRACLNRPGAALLNAEFQEQQYGQHATHCGISARPNDLLRSIAHENRGPLLKLSISTPSGVDGRAGLLRDGAGPGGMPRAVASI